MHNGIVGRWQLLETHEICTNTFLSTSAKRYICFDIQFVIVVATFGK
jgi:hypothetical protein